MTMYQILLVAFLLLSLLNFTGLSFYLWGGNDKRLNAVAHTILEMDEELEGLKARLDKMEGIHD